MARSDTRFRTTYNALLSKCRDMEVGSNLPSELALAEELGVSRTVIRTVLQQFDANNIIKWVGRQKTLIRQPSCNDKIAQHREAVPHEILERRFLEWVLRFDVPPQTPLNVTGLSRDFGVAAPALQEFLASLSRFGLVERRQQGGWQLVGFTRDFALELSEFRLMLELNAVEVVMTRPKSDPIWAEIDRLEQRHHALLERIEEDYHDFSRLDEVFHVTLNSAVKNRFVREFQKLISLIFHYHYQWDKSNERVRNEAAINEHLALMEALKSGSPERAEAAALAHLRTSKETLLSSLRDHNHA